MVATVAATKAVAATAADKEVMKVATEEMEEGKETVAAKAGVADRVATKVA